MKKVMIALLALAVLFSFAACDNNSGTPDSTVGAVARIYSTNIPQYLTGEKIDLADFNLVGEDANGNEVPINLDDIVVVDSSALVADAVPTSSDGQSGTGNQAGRGTISEALSYKGASIVTLYYDAFEADASSLKVTGPATKEEYYVNSASKVFTFNYENYTVTVTYTANGEKVTKTLDAAAGDYTATFTDTSTGEVAVTFTTAVGGTAQTDDKTVKVDVIDDPVVGIVAELKDATATIYSGASATTVADGDYTSIINVYEKLESGYVDESSPITKTAALVFAPATGLIAGTSGSEVYGNEGTYSVAITYTPSGTDFKAAQDVVISKDVITKIAADVSSSDVLNTSSGTGVAVGQPIPKAEITVTPTWASGKQATALTPEEFTIDPTEVPSTATAGGTVDVVVKLVSDTTKTANVTIKVAAGA